MVRLIEKFQDPDSTLKYVFQDDRGTIEITQINTKSDRAIYCVPSLYGCTLGCTFCFLTTNEITNNNNPIEYSTIEECLSYFDNPKGDRQISIMGVGDPSLNIPFILEACAKESRVSIATIMPNILPKLPDNLKIHYSLHSPIHNKRLEIVPAGKNVSVWDALSWLSDKHNGLTEIHYTLIEDVNDSFEELEELCRLMYVFKIPIKFLAFRESGDMKASNKLGMWMKILENETEVEYYDPPGKYVQGSCGQFTKGLYQENPDTSSLSLYVIQ